MIKPFSYLNLVFSVLLHTSVFAETPKGNFCSTVAWIEGEAKTSSGTPLAVGQKLNPGETLETNDTARIKLLLKDNSIVDIGPNSKFKLTSCQTTAQKENIELDLEFGTLRANVVKKLKQRSREFKLKTPTSVLGVRGTEFFVRWQKDSSDSVTEQISVLEGRVEVSSFLDRLKPSYLIDGGTEFRSGGVSGSGKVDQFNASEQKELEDATKIEPDSFKNEVDLDKTETKGTQSSNSKKEKLLIAALTDAKEDAPSLSGLKREIAEAMDGFDEQNRWGSKNNFGVCGGSFSTGGSCGFSFSNNGFPIYQSVSAGM